jgi:hypothetical protein
VSRDRKTAEVRAKEIRLAITRIKKGRSIFNQLKLSISAVAREAGVSAALIHNCHPEIAEQIRESQGRSSRAQRDAKQLELKTERERARQLRLEIALLRTKIALLASINETLLDENKALKSQLSDPKVLRFVKHPA